MARSTASSVFGAASPGAGGGGAPEGGLRRRAGAPRRKPNDRTSGRRGPRNTAREPIGLVAVHPDAFYAVQAIDVRPRAVRAIDPAARTVVLEDTERIAFDGSARDRCRPGTLPVPGAGLRVSSRSGRGRRDACAPAADAERIVGSARLDSARVAASLGCSAGRSSSSPDAMRRAVRGPRSAAYTGTCISSVASCGDPAPRPLISGPTRPGIERRQGGDRGRHVVRGSATATDRARPSRPGSPSATGLEVTRPSILGARDLRGPVRAAAWHRFYGRESEPCTGRPRGPGAAAGRRSWRDGSVRRIPYFYSTIRSHEYTAGNASTGRRSAQSRDRESSPSASGRTVVAGRTRHWDSQPIERDPLAGGRRPDALAMSRSRSTSWPPRRAADAGRRPPRSGPSGSGSVAAPGLSSGPWATVVGRGPTMSWGRPATR